ncbi:MAG: hypothetical protein ACOYB7_18745 [Mycobacterium sp.]
MEALGDYAADHGVTRVLIESCSQDKQDRAAVVGVLATRSAADRVRVVLDRPTAHELLWAADLVAAWAYGAGGATRAAAIAPLVTMHPVEPGLKQAGRDLGRRRGAGHDQVQQHAKAGRPSKTCWLPASLPRLFTEAL